MNSTSYNLNPAGRKSVTHLPGLNCYPSPGSYNEDKSNDAAPGAVDRHEWKSRPDRKAKATTPPRQNQPERGTRMKKPGPEGRDCFGGG